MKIKMDVTAASPQFWNDDQCDSHSIIFTIDDDIAYAEIQLTWDEIVQLVKDMFKEYGQNGKYWDAACEEIKKISNEVIK